MIVNLARTGIEPMSAAVDTSPTGIKKHNSKTMVVNVDTTMPLSNLLKKKFKQIYELLIEGICPP